MPRYENVRRDSDGWESTLHDIDRKSRYSFQVDSFSNRYMDDIVDDGNRRVNPLFYKKSSYVPRYETHGNIRGLVPSCHDRPIRRMMKNEFCHTEGPVSKNIYPADEGPVVHSYLGNLSWMISPAEEDESSSWSKIYDYD